tara:strand:+ start:943 stop:1452 length:510 start_codon:yes stop_codon:yes gene_type:complete
MANSLISPITIDGTAYCNTCEGGRSTKGVLTEDILFTSSPEIQTAVITNDCSPWQLMTGSLDDYESYNPEGEISFGVSCGTTVNIDFSSSSSGGTGDNKYWVAVLIHVDGVNFTTITVYQASPTGSRAVTVTGGACGSIVTMHAILQDFPGSSDFSTTATATAEVTSIT